MGRYICFILHVSDVLTVPAALSEHERSPESGDRGSWAAAWGVCTRLQSLDKPSP